MIEFDTYPNPGQLMDNGQTISTLPLFLPMEPLPGLLNGDAKPAQELFSARVDLDSIFIGQSVTLGYTAATDGQQDFHEIKSCSESLGQQTHRIVEIQPCKQSLRRNHTMLIVLLFHTEKLAVMYQPTFPYFV